MTPDGEKATPVALCNFDKYMLAVAPDKHQPISKTELLCFLHATEDTFDEVLTNSTKNGTSRLRAPLGGRIPVVGVRSTHPSVHKHYRFTECSPCAVHKKPTLTDESLLYFPSPESILAIRLWSDDEDRFAEYCLDFFDTDRHVAFNTPKGWEIHTVSTYARPIEEQIHSHEAGMGIPRGEIEDGLEHYILVEEGMRLVLVRLEDDFFFQIPSREYGHVMLRGREKVTNFSKSVASL